MQANELQVVNEDKPTKINYDEVYSDSAEFQKALKIADYLSKSTFIPKEFQNKPSDCLIALSMSQTLGIAPMEVMRGMYVVHGKPALTAQFAISLANTRGPFKSNIEYEYEGSGESLAVTAIATHAKTGKVHSAKVSMKQAIAAGWANKNPNYKVIPDQMLSYRAATLLIRKCCPEILAGLHTKDEILDTQPRSNTVEAILEKAGNDA